MSDADGILERIAADGVRVVDFRFTDLAGRWRHVARDAAGVDAEFLREGLLVDGSAVPGWREVTEADLLLRPDLGSAWLDPFSAQPTLVVHCDGADPASGLGYERDPRSAAQRAEAHLARSGIADEARVGVDICFFLFDDVRVDAGRWTAGYGLTPTPTRPPAGGGGGHSGRVTAVARPGADAAYLALPPADPFADLRAEMASILAGLGVEGLTHGHGRAPQQNEFALGATGLTRAADRVQAFRYVAHMVAASYGKAASFLPKPLGDEPGSGLRVHQSLWRAGRPAFAGQGYADLSPACLQFVAGVIRHARALNAFTNPTTNSYRRLRFGQDEPVLLAYAAHNRSAALRIPYARHPEGKRVELGFPDPCANPYLAFAAVLMAGLDGIERRLEPGEPADRNLYDLPPEEAAGMGSVCRSLDEALDALETDHDFLTRGEVMPEELIRAYVRVKRGEIEAVERVPHPAEFALYA
ncbi:MAG TPA: type I glutamate--ammonia ligase [Geminicoccaceae bacterium]